MAPKTREKAQLSKRGLGFNQQHVLSILKSLSAGDDLEDVSYYGGSVTGGKRCISIGRGCRLVSNIPWEIIDLRHVGKLFWISEHQRLGVYTHKTFNRVIHSLRSRGILLPVSYDEMLAREGTPKPAASRLRFVRINGYYA